MKCLKANHFKSPSWVLLQCISHSSSSPKYLFLFARPSFKTFFLILFFSQQYLSHSITFLISRFPSQYCVSLKTLYKFIFHSAPHPPFAFPPVIPYQSRAWVGFFYSILGLFYSILVSCSALLALSLMKIFGRFGVGEGWQDKKSWHCFGNNFTVTLQSCLSLVETP